VLAADGGVVALALVLDADLIVLSRAVRADDRLRPLRATPSEIRAGRP